MQSSPFLEYRHLVLGSYRTAAYLRQFVMALANGTESPVGLSYIAILDEDHFEVCLSMLAAYREHGKDDASFVSLAREVAQLLNQQTPEERRQASLELWINDVETKLSMAMMSSLEIALELQTYASWYEDLFDAGTTPDQAAKWAVARASEAAT